MADKLSGVTSDRLHVASLGDRHSRSKGLNSHYTRLAFAIETLIIFAVALSLTSARSTDIVVASTGYDFNFLIFFKQFNMLRGFFTT